MTLKICQIDLSEAELLFQIQAFEQSVRVIKLNKTFCFCLILMRKGLVLFILIKKCKQVKITSVEK